VKKIILLTVTFVLAFAACPRAGDVIVIVNRSVPDASVSRAELERIFLGKKTVWENGKKIVPVIQDAGAVHKAFLKEYLAKNPSTYDIYWKQAVFTGTGSPPGSLSDDAQVVRFVSGTDGAVGYIDSDTPHADVKPLEVR
jgi:ABC-type phosphate transport system substrate-binding protein